jgi:hypothetical protein
MVKTIKLKKENNMRKVILGLMVLSSLSAFANPKDSDRVGNIGIGSRLIVEKDISISPNTKEVRLNAIAVELENAPLKIAAVCTLRMKGTEPYARVISEGSVLEVLSTNSNYRVTNSHTPQSGHRRGYTTYWYQLEDNLKLSNDNLESMTCYRNLSSANKADLNPVKIIELKKILDGFISLEYAEPRSL